MLNTIPIKRQRAVDILSLAAFGNYWTCLKRRNKISFIALIFYYNVNWGPPSIPLQDVFIVPQSVRLAVLCLSINKMDLFVHTASIYYYFGYNVYSIVSL